MRTRLFKNIDTVKFRIPRCGVVPMSTSVTRFQFPQRASEILTSSSRSSGMAGNAGLSRSMVFVAPKRSVYRGVRA